MAGLIGRITVGQIVPRSTGAQHPKNSVQHGSRIAPGPTTTVGTSLGSEQGLEDLPLRLGQLRAQGRLPVAATRSIASRARSRLLTLTFDISQLRGPRSWAMSGRSQWDRAPLGRRRVTPGPDFSLS